MLYDVARAARLLREPSEGDASFSSWSNVHCEPANVSDRRWAGCEPEDCSVAVVPSLRLVAENCRTAIDRDRTVALLHCRRDRTIGRVTCWDLDIAGRESGFGGLLASLILNSRLGSRSCGAPRQKFGGASAAGWQTPRLAPRPCTVTPDLFLPFRISLVVSRCLSSSRRFRNKRPPTSPTNAYLKSTFDLRSLPVPRQKTAMAGKGLRSLNEVMKCLSLASQTCRTLPVGALFGNCGLSSLADCISLQPRSLSTTCRRSMATEATVANITRSVSEPWQPCTSTSSPAGLLRSPS